ncbi:hypothetical protein [Noviherbaspirillum pedocola]|uniref:Uncharacterized protein n=1 Tax=Noviherbaspirillum pedocola TaxID=2801341 RepID=A0A934T264_9BURK|nr:hypothetical protein [Noviherbaspirillum pedocola]MBK4737639.1 hypothetical protein [Noviherbaspirillum pedocola]
MKSADARRSVGLGSPTYDFPRHASALGSNLSHTRERDDMALLRADALPPDIKKPARMSGQAPWGSEKDVPLYCCPSSFHRLIASGYNISPL